MKQILMVGFSGILDSGWVEDQQMMKDKDQQMMKDKLIDVKQL